MRELRKSDGDVREGGHDGGLCVDAENAYRWGDGNEELLVCLKMEDNSTTEEHLKHIYFLRFCFISGYAELFL